MAAIFPNGRHMKVLLKIFKDNVRTERHFTMCVKWLLIHWYLLVFF